MDALLLGSATALVVRKWFNEKRSQNNLVNDKFKNQIVERVQPDSETESESSEEEPEQTELGIDHNITSGGLPFTPENETAILNNIKNSGPIGTGYFDEQFFPSDGRTTGNYSTRPKWLNQEKEFVHREETLAAEPTPEDVFEINYRKDIREMGDRYTKDHLHMTKSKVNESSVESIWTGNGNYSTDGYHPKNQAQLYKYLPPDNDTINIHSTVQGKLGFKTTADKVQETLTNDKKEKGFASFEGIPIAPTFKPASGSSFETTPSNAEGYLVSKHINAASHGPVEKVAYKNNDTVTPAHNYLINTFLNSVKSSSFTRRKNGDMEPSESRFKSAEIERPVVSGAAGGLTLSKPKESEIKTSGDLENLGVRMSGVTSSVGASALVKKKAVEGNMLMAEPRLFETKNNADDLRKTNTQLKKSFQLDSGEFTSSNDRENISASEFTTNNILVKPNESLGPNRFNPTTSISFGGGESKFKEESGVSGFEKLGFGFDRTKMNNRSVIEKEMEENQGKSAFETLFSDRLKLLGGCRKLDLGKGKDLTRTFNNDEF